MSGSTKKLRYTPQVLPWDFYRVECVLTDPLLGTVPKSGAVFSEHLQSRAAKGAAQLKKLADRAEVPPELQRMPAGDQPLTAATAEEYGEAEASMIVDSAERGYTGFLIDDHGNPVLSSHMIGGMLSSVATTYRDTLKLMGFGHIDKLKNRIKVGVGIVERLIKLPKPPAGEDYDPNHGGHPLINPGPAGPVCERPIRCSTPQGDRTAVAKSDVVLGGSKFSFTLKCLKGVAPPPALLHAMLAYGEFMGLGQWRSSKVFGRFRIERFVALDYAGNEIDLPDEPEPAAADDEPKKPRGRAAAKPKAAGKPATKPAAAADDDDDDDDA